ncbi:hypothetical protein K0504_05660 [Neiella marina]|uniref:Uncharacterized protein n=1 Tax=Neiella holothuriorum TaxID=2870530 RepID=A0ABS7EDW1_9GAMM|nr:hypothetical protein [Neiella holothuriorum]MBW8190518.1 hypothetical protein [Neiella holothuriorum]
MNRPYYWAISAVVALAAVVFAIAVSLEPSAQKMLMQEHGPIESLSALGYLIAVVVMLKAGGQDYLKKYWYFAVVFVSFAAREMDFDKSFTNVGVLKSKFFFSPEVSIMGKLVAAVILGFILFALISIVRHHGKAFIAKVFTFRWDPVVWSIGFAGSFLVISKSLDGLGRKLRGWGIADISAEVDKTASLIEESMELAVPYLFIIAILAYLRRQRG